MAHISEIAGYIQLQDIGVTLIISGAGADEFVNPVDAVQGSFTCPATVGIVNQFPLNNMIDTAMQ